MDSNYYYFLIIPIKKVTDDINAACTIKNRYEYIFSCLQRLDLWLYEGRFQHAATFFIRAVILTCNINEIT